MATGLVSAALVCSGVVTPTSAAAEASSDSTIVTERITSPTTWTADNGPYILRQQVEIARGASLTVEAGTRIEVDGGYLHPFGDITLQGTEPDPVRVEGANPYDFLFMEGWNEPLTIDISHSEILGMAKPFAFANYTDDRLRISDSRIVGDYGAEVYAGNYDYLLSLELTNVEASYVVLPKSASCDAQPGCPSG